MRSLRNTEFRGNQLQEEISAWQLHCDQMYAKVNWQFTTADARVKLKRFYPSFDA